MYQVLLSLTQPFTLLLIALIVVLLAAWRSVRVTWSRVALLLGILLLVVSHPFVAWLCLSSLERQYPPSNDRLPHDTQAIVVLSGGLYPRTTRVGGLSEDSLVRTVYAAELYRAIGPKPVVVTGGRVNRMTTATVAERMRDVLVGAGVPVRDILVENRAGTTQENAVFVGRLLHPQGIRRIVLVTEGFHLPRSVTVFRAAGFDVVPSGCNYLAAPRFTWTPEALLPSPRAAYLIQKAAHEWVGMLYYRARGWTGTH